METKEGNQSAKQPNLLIKGGTVVNADGSFISDVFVEGDIIKRVGQNLPVPPGARVLDARDMLIMPGGIDTHTHLEAPFRGMISVDDFYHGTRAALAGGTTMIFDFALQDQTTPLEEYELWRGKADPKVCCDYALHVGITGWTDETSQEMEKLANELGVNSFKVFMAFTGIYQICDAVMYKVLKKCRELKAITLVHAENGELIVEKEHEVVEAGITGPEGYLYARPEEGEAEATNRAITIADQVGCPVFIVHVMCKTGADAVAKARKEGQVVYGEPITASLGRDGTHHFHECWMHAAAPLLSPPLRPDHTVPEYLMDMLARDDLQVTGSDNCTFNMDQKALGKDDFRKIPLGVNGLEDRMSLVWEKGVHNGKMDACRFVAVTSTNAAKIFNIFPRKGCIAEGSDADIVVWDPNTTRTISAKTHHHNNDFNIFEGTVCHGIPVYVISRGRVCKDEHGVHVTAGSGQYIPCPPNSEFVYSQMKCRDKVHIFTPVKREPYTGPVAAGPSH